MWFACVVSTTHARVQQPDVEKCFKFMGLERNDLDNEPSGVDIERAHFYHRVIALKERK